MTDRRTPRPGGRSARVAARAAPPQVNPAPPGQRGGQYKPLSDDALGAITDAAFRILEDIGMAEATPDLVALAEARGARVGADGRLRLPRGLVEEVIAGAAKRFTLHGRAPGRDIEVGGDRVWFGTGGAAVQARDLETGQYRPSTLADLHDFTRLVDALPNISWFTRCCIGTDIADVETLELNTAYALVRNTTKPVGMSFTLPDTVGAVVELFDLAQGGRGAFRERPFCQAHISPVVSPLKYGEDAIAVAKACTENGVPVNAIIAAQSGATAPATPAGMLAQSTAETMAGLVMVNLFAPGHPVIFSNWPFVIDLRTGAFAGSGGESSLMNAAAAQIGRALGLPTGVAASMADAKAVDAQMGSEKAMSAMAAGLAGANMVYESAGMMAALLGASFEAFVADDEMLGQVNRILRGVEADEAAIGFEAIAAAVAGEGHFLGSDHTMAAMERDYLYPRLSDRATPRVWEEAGARDMEDRARDRARDILSSHRPDPLGAADGAIRTRFPGIV